ncbi:hypothetical protein GCM10009760_45910 [Kitasatospora kazusensis]|uniref:Ig-like domain-containing protein n=1 Tax=Kitasatospora kazusensis TaxID=407974 RepID=A0ABN3A113_9ACTN
MSTTRRSILLSAAGVGGAALGAGAVTAPTASAATAATPVYPSTSTVALGNVSGSAVLDLSAAATFTCTVTGDTVFTFTNWPTGSVATEPTVIATQDGTGHTISFSGVTWLPGGTPPLFQTGPHQVDISCFFSDDNGSTVYGQGGTSAGGGFGVYGDGSDGPAVLDGTATYPSFLGKSGSYYWLLRDVYLSSLAVAPGITLQLGGGDTPPFRLFCSGLVSIAATGGVAVYTNSSAAKAAGGSLLPGAWGPAGGTGAGAAGANVLGQSGKSAGQGGAAKSGATAGGAAGVSSLPAGYSLPRALPWAAQMAAFGPNVTGTTQFFPGGASGGAGAGDGSAAGGAGGAGGSPLFIAACNLVNNGSIISYGGRGGAAAGGNAGGGGGGQGGPLMLVHSSYSGSGAVASTGGPGGAGAGSGASGTAGGASWITRLVN